jgi:hypothetical protein
MKRFHLTAALTATALLSSGAYADNKEACANAYEQSQAHLRDGRLAEAKKELAACAAACPEELRRDCEQWSGDRERAQPTVILRAREAGGGRVTGATAVEVEGQRIADELDGPAIAVDPGTRTFRFRHPDGRSVEVTITLAPGTKNQPVEAEFPARARPAPPPASPAAARSSSVSTRRVAAYTLGGVGGAAAVAGLSLVVWGHVRLGELESDCLPQRCPAGTGDGVRTAWNAGGILLGVGGAALGVATVLILTEAPRPSQGRPAWRLGVAPGGATLSASF